MTGRQNKPAKMPRSATYIVISFLVLCIVLTATVWRPAIVNQLNRWKLLPEPEKLTELYFAQPNNLPTAYTPGQSQPVSFTVHNIEYRTMTYHYAVIEESQDGSQKQTLASDNFTIKQDQYKTVSLTAPLADMGQNAKVVISLPTVHESIDYLITRVRSN